MRLSVKFPLVQIAILTLFTFALTLAVFIFQEMNRLIEKKLIVDQLNNNVLVLRDELALMLFKPQSPALAYFELSSQFEETNELVDNLRVSKFLIIKENDEDREISQEIVEQWDSIYKSEIDPLLTGMLDFNLLADDFESFVTTGIRDSLGPLYQSENQELYNQLRTFIAHVETLQNEININLSKLTYQATISINENIDKYSRNMIINAVIVMIFMLGISLVIAWFLSHSIANNIKRLDEAISQVATGNFDFTMKASGKDEFNQISDSFNTLTEMLWFKLDSLKDIMRDVGKAIENESSADEIFSVILELAIDSTGADSAILMLNDDDLGGLHMGKHLGYFPPPIDLPNSVKIKKETMKEWFDSTIIPLSGNILGEACFHGSTFYVHDNESQKVFPNNVDKDSINYLSSVILLSLNTSNKKIGIIGLAKSTPGEFFHDLDNTYMKSYANFVSITLDNFEKYQELVKKHEINREIEVAAEIQNTLLPSRMPPMKKNRIAAFSHAAKGVSGDYYDVFPLDDSRTVVIICDVSGKGIPASLFMVMFRTVLRTLSEPHMNASQILTVVNREISANFQSGTFATASLMIIDHNNNTISFSNGAHYPLYIYRKSKKAFIKFDSEGLPLGIDMRGTYGHKMIKVYSGDYIFLFTDGLTEARNSKGEELGTGRLLKFASQYIDKSPDRMKEIIRELIVNFEGTAGQHDDETFMAIRIGE